MSDIILAVILIVAILAIAYYLIKKMAVLVVNAVLGLILLFILNFLQVMQWVGRPDIGYSLATLIICGVGGLPGCTRPCPAQYFRHHGLMKKYGS